MNAYLKEKIGDPDLFVGREKQLRDLLKWTEGIKKEISMSRAILSRRKTGKTALLQRLYNIVFDMDDGVVPFYYEIGEGAQWIGDFCSDFFLKFVLQYAAFKTRNPEYVQIQEIDFQTASEIVLREKLDYLAPTVEHVAALLEKNYLGRLWDSVREIPYKLAWARKESILQIVDEFQFLNSEIYLDQALSNPMRRMASGYMRTAEYKNAPLLVSGS